MRQRTSGAKGENGSAKRGAVSEARKQVQQQTNGDAVVDRVDKGRQRSGFEIPRKMLHSSISILVSYLWLSHPNVSKCIKGLSIALVIIASADFLRFRSPSFERTYEKVLGLLMREHERGTSPATSTATVV